MLMKLHNKNKNQEGFGLLELMLAMVVAAVLIMMATKYYQSARANARINAGIQLVQEISSAEERVALATGSYTATPSNLEPYLGGSNSLQNPWSAGDVSLTASASSSVFTISIPVGDDKECTQFAALMDKTTDGGACDSGTVTVTIGNESS